MFAAAAEEEEEEARHAGFAASPGDVLLEKVGLGKPDCMPTAVAAEHSQHTHPVLVGCKEPAEAFVAAEEFEAATIAVVVAVAADGSEVAGGEQPVMAEPGILGHKAGSLDRPCMVPAAERCK